MAESVNTVSVVDLGFLEECDDWKLRSFYFPSKVGGKPAWLDLFNLPEKIICTKCNKPCVFLCQIYAPIEEKISCFHRTIYIFMCKDPDCCVDNDSSNFIVLRCQLSRENKFYSFDPPIEEENWVPNITAEQCTLCNVCGAKGPSRCGKCKMAFYCSREHQIMDWKLRHKAECTGSSAVQKDDTKSGFLLPQFELTIGPEEASPEEERHDEDRSEESKLKEFEELVKDGKAGTMQGDTSLDKLVESKEDKEFNKFSKQIKKNPDQVLRYERGGEPLWISSTNIPKENEIPSCEHCGASRHYEFQILPQMLNSLNLDDTGKSVDWGILAIYTCSQSCDGDPAYKKEFMWKQDIISET